MIRVKTPSDPYLLALLADHPRVEILDGPATPGDGLQFEQGAWRRELLVGDPTLEVSGLVELMDNNPMVCADRVSVPDAAGTLALIALGPLVRAGLLREPPVVQTNVGTNAEALGAWLATAGWTDGGIVEPVPAELGGVDALTALAVIPTPEDWSEIDGLYDEAFARSFFVGREDAAEWHVRLVQGTPRAVYRLAMTPDEPDSLLRIQVMADHHGKCGAAQVVHAMNVMAGFEESLGLE